MALLNIIVHEFTCMVVHRHAHLYTHVFASVAAQDTMSSIPLKSAPWQAHPGWLHAFSCPIDALSHHRWLVRSWCKCATGFGYRTLDSTALRCMQSGFQKYSLVQYDFAPDPARKNRTIQCMCSRIQRFILHIPLVYV